MNITAFCFFRYQFGGSPMEETFLDFVFEGYLLKQGTDIGIIDIKV